MSRFGSFSQSFERKVYHLFCRPRALHSRTVYIVKSSYYSTVVLSSGTSIVE